ncbi:MAG: hypothetical protein CL530_01575 [Aequorivita sp.]|jgi:hypothetical protein|nr:hypothetical protein [Aequorivita sp.]|tara:strand:- start:300 stop:524 length:225 start_codon:yes stop_codon:yes gene_type:complete
MGKVGKDKRDGRDKRDKKDRKDKRKKDKKIFKTECCEKYLKKGEHKRCKRCPCFDLPEAERQKRKAVLLDDLLM